MKYLLLPFLALCFVSFSQSTVKPQFGAFANVGLRDFTYGLGKMNTRFGLDVKHSTRNGVLRLVYATGITYDNYKRQETTVNRYTVIEDKVQGISVTFRPEFRFVNKPRFSMYAGVGPRFCGFYSFMEKVVVTENGTTGTYGWRKRGTYEIAYFGIHGALSADYKFSEHWALNVGLNAFASFEFNFYDGEIFSGGNLTTGVAYIF